MDHITAHALRNDASSVSIRRGFHLHRSVLIPVSLKRVTDCTRGIKNDRQSLHHASKSGGRSFEAFTMAFHDFQTFRDLFVGELQNLDIHGDTFARVMCRAGGKMSWPGPVLSRRESNHLHGLYLEALSDAIRRSRPKAVDCLA